MAISYSEYAHIVCPACGAGFEADVWTLVDAAERSDLAQALRDDTLNIVTCPKCGHQGPAGAALLYHDPAGRRLYFAVPPGVREHAWRERAQELLYLLVGSLPEEERRPYLGDVQIEQELEGVRRAVLRRDRRRGGGAAGRQSQEPPTVDELAPPPASLVDRLPAPPLAPTGEATLVGAARALLAADSEAEFAEIVAAHPALLGESADATIRQLADLSYAEGERDLAAALHELRVALARMRSGAGAQPPEPSRRRSEAADSSDAPQSLTPNLRPLSDAAYQALQHAASPEELRAAARDYPALLEEWADADLTARTEAALDEGNERLARAIETRRDALAELRAQMSGRDPLLQAVRALMQANGEAAVADVISAYPMLLTDAAQDALFGLAANARAQGDANLAEYAISCRALLRTVRAGLEEQ
jgi:hypothetical protein